MSNWEETRLADVCAKPQYGAIASGSADPSGPLFVRQTDITRGVIDWASVPYCDLAPESIAKYAIQRGDLLISRLGNGVGNAATVRDSRGAVFAGYLVRFQTNPNQAVPEYVGYQLQTSSWRAHVRGYRSGAAQPTMNAKQMGDFRFQLPPLGEQRRIVAVLSAFDDLIDLNRGLISSARELARELFVCASVDQPAVAFGEIASLMRNSARADEIEADARYLALDNFATGGGGIHSVGKAVGIDSNKSRFRSGDVLYGKLRPYFRKHDRPGFEGVCSTEIWVLRPLPPYGAATLDAIVAQPSFTDFAMAGSGGTRMPRANWNHVATMPVNVPTGVERDELDAKLEELWRITVDLQEEVADVTRARDELLPLLMSGALRIDESFEVA